MREIDFEMERTMRFVADIAHSRHPWLRSLRGPTEAEFRAAERFVDLFPTEEQEIDRTPTKVISVDEVKQ